MGFKVGDIVKGNDLSNFLYRLTTKEMTKGIVTKIYREEMIITILEHKTIHSSVGKTYAVKQSSFDLVESFPNNANDNLKSEHSFDEIKGSNIWVSCESEDEMKDLIYRLFKDINEPESYDFENCVFKVGSRFLEGFNKRIITNEKIVSYKQITSN